MGVADPHAALERLAVEMDATANRATELAERVAAEADRLTEKSRDLIAQAGALHLSANTLRAGEGVPIEDPAPEPEKPEPVIQNGRTPPPSVVGRNGRVNLDRAIAQARELGEFTRNEFAEALGLKPIQVGTWLNTLRVEGVVEHVDGAHYQARN